MMGILANTGIAGSLTDIYNFNGHIKLPPALTPTGFTQDVAPLKPLYGILQEEFKELIFSKLYCTEVGPLPLFLREKIVWEHLTNAEKSEKDKAGKEKAGKSIRGSMVLGKPITRIPGQ
ncbi:hypothetical protein BT96DRAFT_941878 [Gymnopus androsaceus JB14]|uniref:Uncharacterized protein n=1 Tax=Gymnopus androsaceus JB14 TaxID=1447944 RepID=A0A6A4HH62_9AGAR|nr:hypothetical protein BT96DRAFT_941878 [Gymnopus androsaceus JB14]